MSKSRSLAMILVLLCPATFGQSLLSIVDVKHYGAKGDGVTDDSTAVINAITALTGATGHGAGGTIYFSPGTYLINSCLNIPNDGGTPGSIAPAQPALHLIGSGAAMNSMGSGQLNPRGGSMLDLRCNPTTGGKIFTIGQGLLEIAGLTLIDGGSDSAPFVYTTNTVLHIHDDAFFGTLAATLTTSAANDAIVLGGTSNSIYNFDYTGPFQGYGTVIRDNHFRQIKRAVVAQTFANSPAITNNTIFTDCGFVTGAAFDLLPGTGNTQTAIELWDNLVEVVNYKWGVHFGAGSKWNTMHNDFYDGDTPSSPFVAPYHFDQGANENLIIDGMNSGTTFPCFEQANVTDKNSCLSGHANQISALRNGLSTERLAVDLATTLVPSDFILGAGWGSTASTAITLATSKDQWSVTTITTGGTGIALNPTYQIIFHDGTWTQIPVCMAVQTGGNDIFANLSVTGRNATSYVFQWNGTPTTGKTYEITIQCGGT